MRSFHHVLHKYFLFVEPAIVDADLKEIVANAVGALSCDFIKLEQDSLRTLPLRPRCLHISSDRLRLVSKTRPFSAALDVTRPFSAALDVSSSASRD